MGNRSSAQAARPARQPFPDGRVTVGSFEHVDGDDGRMCLALETRTTAKDSHEVTEQRFLFDASAGRRFSVGALASNDVVVTDPNVQAKQAFLEVLPGGVVRFIAAARSYQMLSPPDALGSSGLELCEGQVIKMGACSVQVMAIQLPPSEKDEDKDPEIVSESSSCRSEPRAAAAAAGGTVDLTRPEMPQTRISAAGRSSPIPPSAATRCNGGEISEARCSTAEDAAKSELGDDTSCFICMCGSSAEMPLMPSPCSCRARVHRACLRRWVESKGSRSCSICKTKLPFSATVDAPYLVFQVIRHMRGLQWNGEREYILSFFERAATAGRARVVVGSHGSCGIRLPDPSMSKQHAEVSYDSEARTFFLSDLKSRAGTFIKVVEPVVAPVGQLARFKFARTTMSIEVGTLADIKAMAAARRIAEASGDLAQHASGRAAAHRAQGASPAPRSSGPAPAPVPTTTIRPAGSTGGGAGPLAPAASTGARARPRPVAALEAAEAAGRARGSFGGRSASPPRATSTVVGRNSHGTPGPYAERATVPAEHTEPILQAWASQHSMQGEDSAQPSAAASPLHSDH
ncbi:hypothetical protein FNF27_02248 [Cafeteria roenbergensis]|uniref:RING-CH-type domain-containing protein n=1 Tax=Cafeteria roenbergensis TaxID=33653 RepID=A0A5A8D1G2_CAFRO|nr:hypothetical protein FNF28_06357 [Cafeteria roenbergensis]KAA0168028.1 hypothetical protein FNF31_00527 [Cafeteria roenbergensis]KAA0176191.1 hypothetical protein FNF27_02248 [Cafeteria roenbergensis]